MPENKNDNNVVVAEDVCEEIINPDGFHLRFFDAWCKACGICISFCPEDVFEKREDGKPIAVRPGDCTNCGICEVMCPDFAIGWYTDPLCNEFLDEEYEVSRNSHSKPHGQRKVKVEHD